jgi:hypothetical protein
MANSEATSVNRVFQDLRLLGHTVRMYNPNFTKANH